MIRLLLLILLITSCASNKKHYTIKESSFDSLRSESLYRYSEERLKQMPVTDELTMCHKGEIDKALEKFETQLDKRSKDPLYWSSIGTCYYLKEEFPKAKFYYQLSLGLTKKKEIQASIYNNMGLIFLKVKKYHEAQEHFIKALDLTPNSITPLFNMTQVYIGHRHYKKAQKNLTKLLKKAPNDIDFHYWQAHLYMMTGKYQKAKKEFAKIPVTYLQRQDIANNYAMLLYLMGDYKLSAQVLNNGDKTGPLNVLNARVEIEKKLRDKVN